MRNLILSVLALTMLTVFAVVLAAGCGSKKPKTKTSGDTDGGVADAGEEGVDEEAVDTDSPDVSGGGGTTTEPEPEPEPEPEAEPVKGPARFPAAPANDFADRSTKQYLVSIKKAQIIPAKPTSECWDDCQGQAQMAIGTAVSKVGALPPNSQSGFDFASKALGLAVNAVGGASAFPDVFVHVRCGHDQGHKTNVANDKMVATWTYENKKMDLDVRDQCVFSVWDKDDDGDEEIGVTTVPLVQMANAGGGKAVIYTANEGFGHVYSLEIGVTPTGASGGGSSGGSTGGGSSGGGLAGLVGGLIGGGGSTGGGSTGGAKPPEVKQASYSVEVVKAQIQKQKKDKTEWDAIPKKAEGLLGALGGAAGGKDPDVFVEAWANGYKSSSAFLTTAVKNENYWPVWNETGGFNLKDTDIIVFMVWDKDAASNDLIGECKTKPMGQQSLGEVTLKNCGQVDYLVVKLNRN